MKILFNGFQKEQAIDVLKQVHETLQFTYCATIDEGEPKLALPITMEHHDFWSILWGKYPSPESKWLPLEDALIKQMAYCETTVLRMMDRIDPLHPKPYSFRKDLYLKHLQYWNDFLTTRQITHFVTTNIPHEMHDYVIYSLCKAKNIKTLMFCQSAVPDATFLFEDIEAGPVSLQKKMVELRQGAPDAIVLKDYLEAHFVERTDQVQQVQAPFFMATARKQIQVAHSKAYILRKILDKTIAFFRQKDALSVRRWREFISEGFGRYFRREALLKEDRKLWEYYNAIACTPDLAQPYVYVALHFQPECTTSPMGGVFVDQMLIIKLLAASLPDKVLIYVKEHPMQRSQGRRTEFYDTLQNLSKVRLVQTSFPSASLTKNAIAIATATGTVGWEALFYQKPVLMFGSFFYQYAPGVFVIRSQQDARNAMAKIMTAHGTHTLADMRQFLFAVEQTAVKGYSDLGYKEVSKVSVEENIKNLTQALLNTLGKTQV